MKQILLAVLTCVTTVVFSQGERTDWFNASLEKSGVYGIEVNRAYDAYPHLKLSPVIVAVIDDGVDVFHGDLEGKVWINSNEIEHNGIDDDNNGYIDDIYGWNFLGNPNGENIIYENLEITRLYRKYSEKFASVDKSTLDKTQKAEYELYEMYKAEYEAKREAVEENYADFGELSALYRGASNYIMEKMEADSYSMDIVLKFEPATQDEEQIKNFLIMAEAEGITDYMESASNHFEEVVKFHYNLSFSPRSIVNEQEAEAAGTAYGNNMVWAENPEHGTHVAGIIAGVRDNDKGINGVATNARVMALRAVPNGDERDIDVANAIRYAVDNGAKVINMSFGKSYSPEKQLVSDAIEYANSNDVLMIHAAGNDAENNDKIVNYPDGTIGGKVSYDNWLTIGASGTLADTFLVADFSNYGKKSVDVLSPGIEILSLVPDNQTASFSGTSMAAPVITGMAVVLRGAFPSKTAAEIKELILESTSGEEGRVVNVDGKKSKLKKFFHTPGVPSLYRALELGKQP